MTNVRRIYVEKRKEYATEAHEIQTNLVEQLGLTIHSLRIVHRYDVQGISEEILQQGRADFPAAMPRGDRRQPYQRGL